MKQHLLIAAVLAALTGAFGISGSASAQVASANVVATCGSGVTYTAGYPYPITQNTAGQQCGSSTGGGGGASAASKGQTGALATSLTLKSAAGTLYSFNAVADSTLNAAAWYLIIEDATSWGTGAQTPAKCYYVPAGQSTFGGTFASNGVAFATGITVGVSTTGCFTVTSSAHAFISGDYQ